MCICVYGWMGGCVDGGPVPSTLGVVHLALGLINNESFPSLGKATGLWAYLSRIKLSFNAPYV